MTTNRFPAFLYPLISLMVGIYWQDSYAYSFLLLITSIITSLLFLFFQRTKTKAVLLLTCSFCFFSGALLLKTQKIVNCSFLDILADKKINLIAKIIDKERENIGNNRTRDILKLSVIEIQEDLHLKYQSAKFNLLCYSYTPINAQIGDSILAKNIILKKPKQTSIMAQNRNFNDYLIKENILNCVFIRKLYYKIIYSPKLNLNRWIQNKKYSIYSSLKEKITPETFSFFSSIFLGYKKLLYSSNLRQKFGYWGISHYLARSGLHIVLFILLWSFLLGFLPLNIYIKRVLLLCVCLIYQIFSWISISFIRAFCVFLIYQTGKIFNKQTNFLHILTLVCLIILLFNPMQLFFLDFQLSFALTFALAWPQSS